MLKHLNMTLAYHSSKGPKAIEFEYDLIAEIYTNYEMHPLWVKYRDHVKLPVNDNEHVSFDDNEKGAEHLTLGEYQKLKDFILEFEHQLYGSQVYTDKSIV